MDKKWVLRLANKDDVKSLQEDLNICKELSACLIHRGVNNFADAKKFFRPHLENSHHPYLMKDMEKAVELIVQFIHQEKKIMIWGDYDVDGTTAVALFYTFLQENFPKSQLSFYVPDRFKEGYGISIKGIDHAKEVGCQLIVALDCGIKSLREIEYAKSLDIEFIVCDHHLPSEQLPPAFAILNPKQKADEYPYKELSGCGIGLKLIEAICIQLKIDLTSLKKYFALVALSIAADIVPVDGENRLLAYWGLKEINENPSPAFQELKNLAGSSKKLTLIDLAFQLAPRINAAGRLEHAKKAVQLFISHDIDEIRRLAKELDLLNRKRKELDAQIAEEAFEMIQREQLNHYSAVVYSPEWHKGVVGIVASKIVEEHYRPTIVLTLSEGKITGSARSIAGFNIHEALVACKPLLEHFGGHFFAAGMTLLPENLAAFQMKFEEIVGETIGQNLMQPEIEIDAILNFKDITKNFYNILEQMEPFGPGNPQPVFLTKKVKNWRGYSRLLANKHIQLVVSQVDGYAYKGIAFQQAKYFYMIDEDLEFDIVYTIEKNEWNGEESLQLRVIDMREHKTN